MPKIGELRAGVPVPAELVRARRAKRGAGVWKVLPHNRESCKRKKRHDTEESARTEAERMEIKLPAYRFGHYRCRFCGDWHVGRPVDVQS